MESPAIATHDRIKGEASADPTVLPLPAARSRLPVPACYVLLALASGGLLCLCYFPVAWGFLGGVALVPLLGLVRARRPAWVVYACTWLSGLLFFWFVLNWMREADYRMVYTWGALATYCALYFPMGFFLLRRLDRGTGLPLVLTLPAVWTALEYVRAHFGTGFPWYLLGHTQQALLPMIQIADVAGAYAVTFVVAAINAFLFEILYASPRYRNFFSLVEEPRRLGKRRLLVQAAGLLLLVGTTLGYGFWRLSQDVGTPGPQVALIQGNLDQRIKISAKQEDSEEAALEMLHHFEGLSKEAAQQHPRPDLIVWPETSFPEEWQELSPAFPEDQLSPAWRTAKEQLHQRSDYTPQLWQEMVIANLNKNACSEASRLGIAVLLGLDSSIRETEEKSRRYNSAVLLQPDGHLAGRYDKIHRVPFGEYVPFRDIFPWMNQFAPYPNEYSIRVGEHFTRFPFQGFHFGVIICFEDSDPDLARNYVAPGNGPPVDFLLNISNDGWFNGSSEHEEHLAISRFRAVECRRSVARAVNMGISAVIDGNGRVTPLKDGPWSQSKKVAGFLTASIPIDHRISVYARWGDWLPTGCGLLVVLGLLWTVVPWRIKPSSGEER